MRGGSTEMKDMAQNEKEERNGRNKWSVSSCVCVCSVGHVSLCMHESHMCQHVEPVWGLSWPVWKSVQDVGLQATVWEAIHLGLQTVIAISIIISYESLPGFTIDS